MEKINKFIAKTPRKFWLYNSIVALIFFLIAPHNCILYFKKGPKF